MISKEDIQKLADLSRLHIEESKIEAIRAEIDAILGYVGQVTDIAGESKTAPSVPRNVMRSDEDIREGGTYTERLVKEMPKSKDGYLEVKNIL